MGTIVAHRTVLVLLVTAGLAAVPTVLAASPTFSYQGSGVVVLDGGPSTFADNGAVVCEDRDGDDVPERGVGGVCIPFTQLPATGSNEHPAVQVTDDEVGPDVAFQACVDNDGDGRCGFRTNEANEFLGERQECFDTIRFSHGDGFNVNPLAVPSGFADPSCGDNGGFPGVVVMICSGAHESEANDAHSHQATAGKVSLTTTSVFTEGDYCGGPTAEKAYVVR